MRAGWEIKELGEIADIEYGFTDKATTEGDFRYIRITDIDSEGLLSEKEKVYINSTPDCQNFILSINDILMARTGATFAKVLLFDGDEPSVFASYLIRIKFNGIVDHKFYWYFSKSQIYWEQANLLSSGAAQPQFNGNALKRVIFTYPKSLPEQQRIVAILDEAFAAIAKAKANAEQNLKNAKELFESYLQGVFENGDWETKKLNQISENLDSKRVPITKNVRSSGEIPYYGASGIVDYVSDFLFDENLLCISEDGANLLARTYPIAFSISGKTWVNNHAHVLRFNELVTQKFVEVYINSIRIDDYVSGMAQPKLNQAMLNKIPIPMPSLEEQQTIVQKLDALRAETQRLEAVYQQKLADLEELKKSILQKAFAGELTGASN